MRAPALELTAMRVGVIVPLAKPRAAMSLLDLHRPLVAWCLLAVIFMVTYNKHTSLLRLHLDVEVPSESGAAGRAEHGRILDATKPNAVVTTLFTDDYIEGVRVLGYSLRKHNVSARKIALYIPEQVRRRGPTGV
jgi:hypothetical protein